MRRLFKKIEALIVLFPACFWWIVHTLTRNKTEKKFLNGFIPFLIQEIKGEQNKPKRIYP